MLSRDRPGLSAPRSRGSIRKDAGRARPRAAERATRRHSFRTVLNGLPVRRASALSLAATSSSRVTVRPHAFEC